MTFVDASPPLSTTSPITWTAELPGSSSLDFHLWARLPDALGTYTVTGEAGFGAQPPVVTKTLDLLVTDNHATVSQRLSAALQVLRGQASGQNLTKIDDALARLVEVDALATNPTAANVETIVQKILVITSDLGGTSGLDTAAARIEADRLLTYWQSRIGA
jgi:hypothetical protein